MFSELIKRLGLFKKKKVWQIWTPSPKKSSLFSISMGGGDTKKVPQTNKIFQKSTPNKKILPQATHELKTRYQKNVRKEEKFPLHNQGKNVSPGPRKHSFIYI